MRKKNRFAALVTSAAMLFTATSFSFAYAEDIGDEEDSIIPEATEFVIADADNENYEMFTQSADGDKYVIFDYSDSSNIKSGTGLSVNKDVPRLTDVNARLSWDTGGRTFWMLNTGSDASKKLPTQNYNYANMWIYNPSTSSSQITWLFYTGESANDTSSSRYFRYKITANWTGWKLLSVPLGSFSGNSSKASFDYGAYAMRMAVNEWTSDTVKWTKSHYVNVERIWLSKTAPITPLDVTDTSYENDEGFVPSDLGGSKTYTVTMNNEIVDTSVSGKISVLQDSAVVSADDYTVSVDKEKINITFTENLVKGSTYEIVIGSGIYDTDGNILDENKQYSFNIEVPTKLFRVLNTSVDDGAVDVDTKLGVDFDLGEKPVYTISANNDIGTNKLSDKVKLYKNGVLMYNGYSVDAEEKNLKITFDNELEYSSEYSIKLTEDFSDMYGNLLTGQSQFSFTTVAEPADTFEIAVFNTDESINILNQSQKNSSITDENPHIYGKSLRIDIPVYPASIDNSCGTIPVNAEAYSYANYWIYSPKATGASVQLIYYTSDNSGKGYFRRNLVIDWTGWKLVSVNLSEFIKHNGPDWKNVTGFNINANGWVGDAGVVGWEEAGYIQVERIWLSKEKINAFELSGTTLASNLKNMPIKDMSVGFVYSDSIDFSADGNVKLKKGGEVVNVNLSTVIEDNVLYVGINDLLEANTTYTIEVGTDIYSTSGVVLSQPSLYTFTTASDGLTATKPELTDGSGLSAGAKVTVYNLGTENEEAQLHLAFYAEDGTMLSEIVKPQSITAGDDEEIVIPSSAQSGAVLIKAFVTDTKGTLLYNHYAAAGAEEKPAVKNSTSSASAVKITGFTYLEGTRIYIEGTVNGTPDCVLVTIKDENDVILSVPLQADNGGKFEYYYNFGDLESGNYTLTASGYKGVASDTTTIAYLDTDDQTDLSDSINSASNGTAALSVLNKYAKVLGTDTLTEARVKGIAESLIESKPYGDFLDVMERVDKIQTTLDELNQTKWNAMTAFITQNETMIMNNCEAYTRYKALSDKQKNIVNQTIVDYLPTDSFTAFREILKNSLPSANTAVPPSYGGGGGGGGGSSSKNTTSGTIMANNGIAPNSGTNVGENSAFSDIEDVSWAKDSIEKLYKKGVISPSDNGRFRPHDKITREEFVKLLVLAMNVSLGEAVNDFTDTQDGAWYIPYISAAKREGIVQGNTDGKFGVGQQITREDMSVMAYRAAAVLDKEIPSVLEKSEFKDNQNISDYAKDAVYTMQSAGIISGMDNGLFMPKDSASRAQAAKIIAYLMSVLES